MKPRGPLMVEHRLIERALEAVRGEIKNIREKKTTDVMLIDHIVDFIRTYADQTHHGKEEDILFRDLSKKKMSARDAKTMRELIEEHKFGRKTVAELVEARRKYEAGDAAAAGVVAAKLQVLADFYPAHIAKEDKDFFPATERCFTPAELDAMLAEFREFDRKMIHRKYKSLVAELTEKALR